VEKLENKKILLMHGKNDSQFLIYKKIGYGFINLYKQKTYKIAQKVAVFFRG
jgi:hypothetical protein